MLKEFDLDGGNTISKDEFIAVLDAKYSKDAVRTAKWVRFLSNPPAKKAGKKNANAQPKQPEERFSELTAELFVSVQQFDADKNGFIDRDEFKTYLKAVGMWDSEPLYSDAQWASSWPFFLEMMGSTDAEQGFSLSSFQKYHDKYRSGQAEADLRRVSKAVTAAGSNDSASAALAAATPEPELTASAPELEPELTTSEPEAEAEPEPELTASAPEPELTASAPELEPELTTSEPESEP
eukprot:SAG22_NODE_1974_length_3223_cov_2.274648_2_plen_237_part_01